MGGCLANFPCDFLTGSSGLGKMFWPRGSANSSEAGLEADRTPFGG